MIYPSNIADRLEELIREKFPGEEVHRELCPEGFTRPCTLIVQEEFEGNTDLSVGAVELLPVFTITTFVETDPYHHSHLRELHRRQMILAGLLLPGYLQVGNRSPKVISLTFGGGYDFDTVTAGFRLTLCRMDFMELEQTPLMEHLQIREEMTDHE